MNYYDVRFSARGGWYGTRPLSCCAVTEGVIQDVNRGTSQSKVEHILSRAMFGGKSVLIWNVVPSIRSNAEAEEYIVGLPNTTFIGEYTNRNSGRKIRTYVTNLVKEW